MELLFTVVLVAAVVIGLSLLTRARSRPLTRPESSIRTAEDDARRWVEKLGASIPPLDPDAGLAVRESHAEALGRYETAREQFARAASPYQYSLAGRTAIEGLHYLRAMHTANGREDAPVAPATGPSLVRPGQVHIAGVGYYAATRASDAMPFYFPGGTFAGRVVPGGWYGQPWWRSAAAAPQTAQVLRAS